MLNTPNYRSQKAKFLSVVLVSFLVILQWQLFVPGFQTMDDSLMMLISEGFFTGSPGASLVFMHFVPSLFLKWLYESYPTVNWYVWWQMALLLLSINALVLLFLVKFRVLWVTVLFVFFPTVFYAIDVQYTATAILLGTVGWVFFYDYISSKNSKAILLASVFWLLCYWTRWHSFLLLLLLQLPFLTFWAYINGSWRRLLILPALLVCFSVLQLVHSKYYSYKFNQDYTFQYQRAIDSVCNGRDNYEALEDRFSGISRSEYDLIRNWYWIDSEYLSPQRVLQIAEYATQSPVIRTGLENLAGATNKLRGYLLLLLILAWPVIRCCWRSNRGKVLLFLFFVTTVIFYAYFAVFYRLPFRLSYPLVSAQFLIFCYVVEGEIKITYLYILGLVLAGLIVFYKLHSVSARNEKIKVQTEQNFDFLIDRKEVTFIAKGSVLAYEGLFSWFRSPQHDGKHIIATGWHLHTESYKVQMEVLDINNLATELIIGNRDFVLIDPPLEALQGFLCNQYGKRLVIEPYSFNSEYKSRMFHSWRVMGYEPCP